MMIRPFLSIVVLFMGSLFLMTDEMIYAAPEAVEHSVTSTYDGTQQPYILYVPDVAKTQSVSLLVVLHGWGGSERSWIDYTPVVAKAKEYGLAVVAPHGRGNWFYRQPGEQDVLDVIEAVCKTENIDRSRIALAGHSMGGWGTNYIGLRNADIFSIIIPMSGWAPEELLPNAVNLHPFFIHDRDDPVVPVRTSRSAATALVNLGQEVTYKEEIGYGHASSMIGDNMDEIMERVKKYSRSEQVNRVNIATRTPWTHRGERWLRVLQSEAFPETALVESELTTDSTVLKVRTKNTTQYSVDLNTIAKAKRIECDGATFALTGENVAIMTKVGGEWTLHEATEQPQPQTPTNVAIPASLKAIETTGPSVQLTDALASILLPQLDCDLLLLADDQFMVPPGGLTSLDRVWDLCVRSDNRLVKMRISGATVEKLTTMTAMPYQAPRFFPAESVIAQGRTYTVVAPANVVAFVKATKFEYLPKQIGEYLFVKQ